MIIYKAENKINGNIYIGQTSETLKRRMHRHVIFSKKANNIYFYNALRKYGKDNFEWSILFNCLNKKELNQMERYFIACFNATNYVYNMTDGGGGRSGYKLSDDTKNKISLTNKNRIAPNKGVLHTEQTKEKIRLKATNRIVSLETRNKMSIIRKNKKGTYSSETKIKLSLARKKQIPPMLNHKHTESTKIKMSESAKKRWSLKKSL